VPKLKNEPLGIVIVESGWGSMVPTIVLASMAPGGAAARCGQLNVGDQIMSINGVSLVGLPLSTCQNYIKVGCCYDLLALNIVLSITVWNSFYTEQMFYYERSQGPRDLVQIAKTLCMFGTII